MTKETEMQLRLRITELEKELKGGTKASKPRKLRKRKKLPNNKCNFVFQF